MFARREIMISDRGDRTSKASHVLAQLTRVSCGHSAADQDAFDVGEGGTAADGVVDTSEDIGCAGACSDHRDCSGDGGVVGHGATRLEPIPPGQAGRYSRAHEQSVGVGHGGAVGTQPDVNEARSDVRPKAADLGAAGCSHDLGGVVPIEGAAGLGPGAPDQTLARVAADEAPVEVGDPGVLRAEVGVERRDDAVGEAAPRRKPAAHPFSGGAGLAPGPRREAGRGTVAGECAVLVGDLVSALSAAEGDIDLGDAGGAVYEEETAVGGEDGVVVVDGGAGVVPRAT